MPRRGGCLRPAGTDEVADAGELNSVRHGLTKNDHDKGYNRRVTSFNNGTVAMSQASTQADANLAHLVQRHRERPGALLPLLLDIQAQLGYVPPDWMANIADGLNLSRAEVHGVISFYHHIKTTPPARHHVQICRAEACQSMGARQLEAFARAQLGIDFDQMTADGEVELEPVYCLGNCACAPSVTIDGVLHGRVSEKKLSGLFDQMTGAAGGES